MITVLRVLIPVLLIALLHSAAAETHSIAEVNGLIEKLGKKLDEMKSRGAGGYATSEIARVYDHIENTKMLLSDGEIDKAYFEIRIGVEYINLIIARERLVKSKEAHDKFNSLYPK